MLSRSLRALFSLTLISIAVTRANAAETSTLRVRADAWMPYNGDPAAERPGYVVELLRSAFETEKIGIDYQFMAWSEALAACEKGTIEAVIGANRKEAVNLVVPEEMVGEPRMGIFVRKDIQWSYSNLQSLEAIRLGAIEGYSYWESMDEYLRTNSTVKRRVLMLSGETPLADGLAALDENRVDALVETFPVFIWAVKKSNRNVADYRVAFKQEGEPIYVAFAPTDEGRRLAGVFSTRLRELRASGRLEQILKTYGLSDWKQ